jgi:hypothetical protein
MGKLVDKLLDLERSACDACMRISITIVTMTMKITVNKMPCHVDSSEDHWKNLTRRKPRKLDQQATTCNSSIEIKIIKQMMYELDFRFW